MGEVNKSLKEKLDACPPTIRAICQDTIVFAQSMPEIAIKDHLDALIRKAVKKDEASS